MSTVIVRYSYLESSAKQARTAASNMNDYASKLPGQVINPLGSLTGGASGYTSTAASLAQQKARQLQQKAASYNNYAQSVDNFISHARSADAKVKSHMDSLAGRELQGMSVWDRICYNIYSVFCSKLGSTEFGSWLKNGFNFVTTLTDKYLTKAYDWFAYGKGQYVLKIGLSIVGAVLAVAGAVLAFPVGTVLAAIVAIATVVAAVVAVADSIASVRHARKAMSEEDDPGLARYWGSTSSVSDYAKKEGASAGWQTAAKWFDRVGMVAGVVSFVGGFGLKTAADGTKITVPKGELKENILGKFSLKFDVKENKRTFGKFSLFGFGAESTDGINRIFKVAEVTKNALTPVKNIMGSFNTTIETIHSKKITVKNGLGFISSVDPRFKGVNSAASNAFFTPVKFVQSF